MRTSLVTTGLLATLVMSACGGGAISDVDRRDIVQTLRTATSLQAETNNATVCSVSTSRRRMVLAADGRRALRLQHVATAATACGPVLDAVAREAEKQDVRVRRGMTPKGRRLLLGLHREAERLRQNRAVAVRNALRTAEGVDLAVDGKVVTVTGTSTSLDEIELRREDGRWRIDNFPAESVLP